MSDKKVKFWLYRVLLEKCEDTKNLQERISVLGHQIHNFERMSKDGQEEVIKELVEDLRCYDWQEAIEEIEKEILASSVEETEYFMDVGDSIEINGKTLVLDNVNMNKNNSVVIDVDGVKKSIGSDIQNVNGINVMVDEFFYDGDKSSRSANIVVTKKCGNEAGKNEKV